MKMCQCSESASGSVCFWASRIRIRIRYSEVRIRYNFDTKVLGPPLRRKMCYFWNAAQKYVAAEPAPAPPGLPEGGEVQGAALRPQLHVPGGGERRPGGAQQLSGRRGGAQSQRYRFSVSIPDQLGESHKGKENHVRWAMMLFLEKGLMWRTDISSRNKHLEERFCQKNFFCHLQYRILVFFVKKRPASGSHDPYCY